VVNRYHLKQTTSRDKSYS